MNNVAYITLIGHECPSCGVVYGLSESYQEHRQNDSKGWKCPNGHSVVFKDSDNLRLKRRVETLEQQEADLSQRLKHSREETQDQKHKTRAQKAAKTRVKNRAKAGVCQFCNRTIKQMDQHVKSKHPEKV